MTHENRIDNISACMYYTVTDAGDASP